MPGSHSDAADTGPSRSQGGAIAGTVGAEQHPQPHPVEARGTPRSCDTTDVPHIASVPREAVPTANSEGAEVAPATRRGCGGEGRGEPASRSLCAPRVTS